MNTLAGTIMPVISTAPLIAAPHNRPPMFIHAPTSRFPLLLFPVYAIVYIVIFVIICAPAVIFRYESPKRPVLQDRYFHFYVWLSCRAGFYHVAHKCACSPAMSSYVVLVSDYVRGGGISDTLSARGEANSEGGMEK